MFYARQPLASSINRIPINQIESKHNVIKLIFNKKPVRSDRLSYAIELFHNSTLYSELYSES